MKYNDREKEAMRAIGHYYLDQSIEATDEYPNFSKAQLTIQKLSITRVLIEGSELTIYLGSPGMLIGERGKNIEKLGEFLKKELNDSKLHIRIVEDNIYNYLMPIDYSEGMHDFDDFDDFDKEEFEENQSLLKEIEDEQQD
jgi:hypothetical protein